MYLMKDVHGDTTEVLQYGATVRTYDYDAFGKQVTSSGTVENPYRYCGEYIDGETGFIYLRNRYYDPRIGRFMSEDPAKSGLNWYVYCENNPITRIDIGGLEWGYIRDFAYSLTSVFYGVRYEQTGNGSVKVILGSGYLQRSGEFYYNGNAKIPKHRGNSYDIKSIARNNDGKLYMYREDFYSAMGIKYSKNIIETTVKAQDIINISIILASGYALKNYDWKVGAAAGIVTYFLTKGITDGTYKTESTIAEIYNPAFDQYEYIETSQIFQLQQNRNGNDVWVKCGDPFTRYFGAYTESLLN